MKIQRSALVVVGTVATIAALALYAQNATPSTALFMKEEISS